MTNQPELFTADEKEKAALAIKPPAYMLTLSERMGCDAKDLHKTILSTCMYKGASPEEFRTFLLVATKYELNPLAGEIYAFRKNEGGIQCIIGAAAWNTLCNRQPDYDGREFSYFYVINGEQKGFTWPVDGYDLAGIECRIYRKSRQRPDVAFAKMSEYNRPGAKTWRQYPTTMLEHKAFIKCAKAAFGLAGVVDVDDAARYCDTKAAPTAARADFAFGDDVENAEIIAPPALDGRKPADNSRRDSRQTPQNVPQSTKEGEAIPGQGQDKTSAPESEKSAASMTTAQRKMIKGLFKAHTGLKGDRNSMPPEFYQFFEERKTPLDDMTKAEATRIIDAWIDYEKDGDTKTPKPPSDISELVAFMDRHNIMHNYGQANPDPSVDIEPPEDLTAWPFGDAWTDSEPEAQIEKQAVEKFLRRVADSLDISWHEIEDKALDMFDVGLEGLSLGEWKMLHGDLIK